MPVGTILGETLLRVEAVARDAKQSFARAGSQTGVWEPGNRSSNSYPNSVRVRISSKLCFALRLSRGTRNRASLERVPKREFGNQEIAPATRTRTLFGYESPRNSVSRWDCRAGRETEFRWSGFPNGSLGTRKSLQQLVPELCSGTHLRETLFRVEAVARWTRNGVSLERVPKREFGNQKEKSPSRIHFGSLYLD